MKKLFYLLVISVLASSCSVYEDITFHSNGAISYKLTVDASELAALGGGIPEKPSDKVGAGETIVLSELILDELDSEEFVIPQSELDNIAPYYMSYLEDDETKNFEISIFGEFANVEDFHKANTSLMAMVAANADDGSEMQVADILARNNFTWDGKTMTRKVVESPIIAITSSYKDNNEEEDEDTSEPDFGLAEFFDTGRFIVRYHFPGEVMNVDNKDALLTIDRKTVVLDFPGTVTTKPGEALNVIIATK